MVDARLASFALLALSAPVYGQSTYFVDDDVCPGAGSGTQMDPFCSIQAAIDVALGGDTVRVAPGIYVESIRFKGKDLTLIASDGPTLTRISGDASPASAVVTFDAGETASARIEGFSIGPANPIASNGKHGVLCSGASPTIEGNVIENNSTNKPGGGISCVGGADAVIVDNHVRGNESSPGAGTGGGIHASSSSPWILGNVIENNSVFSDPGGYGGGLYLEQSSSLVENNLIIGNAVCDQGFGWGAGVAIGFTGGGTGPRLVGNTIADNSTCAFGSGEGGGIFTRGRVTLRDTILWGNQGSAGSEIHSDFGGNITLTYCDLDTSAGSIAGSGSVVLGAGMLALAPQFVAVGDYHLDPSSPLIDVGYPERATGATDADLEPRVLDGDFDGATRVDIGWDEYDPTGIAVSGAPGIGQSILVDTTAPDGWNYFLAFALGTGNQPRPHYGGILLEPETLQLVSFGSVPGSDSIAIPNDPALVGIPFHLQSLAKVPGPKIGSLSARADLRVE